MIISFFAFLSKMNLSGDTNESLINNIIIIGIFLFSIGGILFIFMGLILAFTNSMSPEEKDKHIKEINIIKAQIAELQSDNWKDVIITSIGEKYNRITSQQYLEDERESQIRSRRYYLRTLEELIK
jgi:hypothetical protein